MGPSAQVDEITATVGRREAIVWYLRLDEMSLEGVVGEEVEGLRFGQDDPFKRFFLMNILFHFVFKALVIILRNLVAAHERVVEESLLNRWSVTQPSPEFALQSLS